MSTKVGVALDASDKISLLNYTPLYDFNIKYGAKMVPFAGYSMPVQYSRGVLKEHQSVRSSTGLFDVSHMGQAIITGDYGLYEKFEKLVPGDIKSLAEGRIRYTQLLNKKGGILDDLLVTKMPPQDGQERLFIVVNASCKDNDFSHISNKLSEFNLDILSDRALLSIQGPRSSSVLEAFIPGISNMPFMSMRQLQLQSMGIDVYVSRCGYTGEDGFEISISGQNAADFAEALVALDIVEPVGLGARNTLRLEAGLCLYGDDIDENTTPIEANLAWSISKRRREEGGFPGDEIIKNQLRNGVDRLLVGIMPQSKVPAREGVRVHNNMEEEIGVITSGGFSPTLSQPIAMGYVSKPYYKSGAEVLLCVRDKYLPANVVKIPFVSHKYYK